MDDHTGRFLCHRSVSEHRLQRLPVSGVGEKRVGFVSTVAYAKLMEIGSVLANDLPWLTQSDPARIEQVGLTDIGPICFNQIIAMGGSHARLGACLVT